MLWTRERGEEKKRGCCAISRANCVGGNAASSWLRAEWGWRRGNSTYSQSVGRGPGEAAGRSAYQPEAAGAGSLCGVFGVRIGNAW